jgi:hypothetical protein
MKKILLFFIFFPALCSAQTIVQDSTWLTNQSGIFYANRFQLYDNGNSTTTVTRVGDTTAVVSGAENVYRNTAASMCGDANVVMSNPAKIREIVRQDAEMQRTLNRSALNDIAIEVDTAAGANNRYFTITGWTLRDNAVATPTVTPIVFSFGSTNAFRYKLGTETIKLAYCLGNVVRILNYKGQGYALDFYKQPSGRWATIDLQQILIPPAAVVNR